MFIAKKKQSESNDEEKDGKPKLTDIPQNIWLVIHQKCQCCGRD